MYCMYTTLTHLIESMYIKAVSTAVVLNPSVHVSADFEVRSYIWAF